MQAMALKQRYNGSGSDTIVKMDYWSAFDCFEVRQKEKPEEKGKPKKKRETAGAEDDRTVHTVDFFVNCKDIAQVKAVFGKLKNIYHSDVNGNPEGSIYRMILDQYEKAKAKFQG